MFGNLWPPPPLENASEETNPLERGASAAGRQERKHQDVGSAYFLWNDILGGILYNWVTLTESSVICRQTPSR